MARRPLSVLTDRPDVLEALRETIDSASDGATLALPRSALAELRTELEAAVDRDAVVLLLLFSETAEEPPDDGSLAGVASAVRFTDAAIPPLMCTADRERGVTGDWYTLTEADHERNVTRFHDRNLAHDVYNRFMGSYWLKSGQLYAREWDALPVTHTDFRAACMHAARLLSTGVEVSVTAKVKPVDRDESARTTTTVTGILENVRQGIVQPATNRFPGEQRLGLLTDEGRVTVGGEGAVVEDYESVEVRFERA